MENTFLVVTGANSWGVGKTQSEALSNANANAYMGRKEYSLTIYRFPNSLIKDFGVDGMGGVYWEWGDCTINPETNECWSEELKKALRDSFKIGNFKRSKNGKLTLIED